MRIGDMALKAAHLDVCEPARARHDMLRRVFCRASDALYRYILVRVGGDRDAADDVLQQTCCEAVRHRRPPSTESECEAWLRGIARNLIRRHWRSAGREARKVRLEDAAAASRLAEDLESRPLPVNTLIQAETVRLLMLAITELPAADQDLVFAYYFHGRPQAAIAQDLGATEKSIESRLYRIRGRLRAALKDTKRSGEP
jgi:RNA polymerase sigma factor (sigma-70 family)